MAIGIQIVKGSIEPIAIDVTDKLGNLTTLDGADPHFDIEDFFNVAILSALVAQNSGMTAICKIDSTNVALEEGDYKLFLYFTAMPDSPRLGPVSFSIVEELMV